MTDLVAGVDATSKAVAAPLRREAAARYIREHYGLPCSPNTLAKYAVTGGGPEFRKAGRYPVYAQNALDAWVAERLSAPVRSTSELTALRHQPLTATAA